MKAMKMTTTLQPACDSEYTVFLAKLKLVGLGLKSSEAYLDRQKFWKLADKGKQSTQRVSETYTVTEVGERYFEAEGRFDVTLGSGEATGLRLSCTFEVHMHATTITKAMAERFAESDLRFVLLPYARHFISDMTGEMAIPPLVLPLVTASHKDAV